MRKSITAWSVTIAAAVLASSATAHETLVPHAHPHDATSTSEVFMMAAGVGAVVLAIAALAARLKPAAIRRRRRGR
mgnify:CR=1 FL=1